MRVVDHDEQRLLLCTRRKDAEGRRANIEAIGFGSRPQRQSSSKRGGLRSGDVVDEMKDGAQELQEAGEGDLCLQLDSSCGENGHPIGPIYRVVEQSRLSDPRLADDDRGAARSPAGIGEELVDPRALLLTPEQHVSILGVCPSPR